MALALGLWLSVSVESPAENVGPAGAKDRPARSETSASGLLLAFWSLIACVYASNAPSRVLLLVAFAASTMWLARRVSSARSYDALCVGIATGATGNALVGLIQFWLPFQADDLWLAALEVYGRATGNLRQANLLGTLCVIGLLAAISLATRGVMTRRMLLLVMTALLLGLAASLSRTAFLSLVLIGAIAAIASGRWTSTARGCLMAAPILTLLFWQGQAWLIDFFDIRLLKMASEVRAQSDLTSGRTQVWGHALEMIKLHPWVGVGPHNFGSAWHLTPLAPRPHEYFDHAHNIILQSAVELGIPIALLLAASILYFAYRGWRRFRSAPRSKEEAVGGDMRSLMILVIGVHSMLEYPLWFGPMLLTFAVLVGVRVEGEEVGTEPARGPRGKTIETWRPMFLIAILGGSAALVYDYRVNVVGAQDGKRPDLEQLRARERASWAFGDLLRYRIALSSVENGDVESIEAALHDGADVRLLIAYAETLSMRGRTEEATYIAQRLREFRREPSLGYLATCEDKEQRERFPFRCDREPTHAKPPPGAMNWW